MKKLMLGLAMLVAVAFGITGCQPGQNVGPATLIGTGAGALIGSQVFDDPGVGIIAGALIGGALGHLVGREMDRQDRINMQSAIINTPVHHTARWRNQQKDVNYEVTPTRDYYRGRQRCRNYRTRVNIQGRGWRRAYGTVCQRNGQWYVS